MNFQSDIWTKARGISGTALTVLFIIYFCFHFVQGKHGLIAWFEAERELAALKTEQSQLHQKRQAFELRSQNLRSSHLDEDLLDEEARRALGFVGDNELIIRR